MKKHLFFLVGGALLISGALAFFACETRHPVPTEPQQQTATPTISQETQDDLARLEHIGNDPVAYYTASTDHRTVEVPAGSHNALQTAIGAAGREGVVIVERGMHTEDNMVTISAPVTLVGERGSTIKFDTQPLTIEPPPAGTVLDVGLYILNTREVNIWGLTILPVGPIGGTAILVQNSPEVVIGGNTIREHQWSVLVQNGDRVRLWGNRVAASLTWQTGAIPESEGMILINGKRGLIANNEVSGGFFGIWPCDTIGVYTNNYTHGNMYGVILCCVPEDAFPLPNGEVVGSRIPTTSWFVANNRSSDNFDTGYLIIDRANNNLLINNAASGNPVYDIELSGDSFRFGFLTPHCRNITVIAGRQNPLVKDCGENNTIIGGRLNQNDHCR